MSTQPVTMGHSTGSSCGGLERTSARFALVGQNRRLPQTTMDPPRPGEMGFDPGEHRGELRDDFRVGTHDPDGRFEDKERRIADRLAEE
jgi:hypothetical protein